jgi:hypothetical protein
MAAELLDIYVTITFRKTWYYEKEKQKLITL